MALNQTLAKNFEIKIIDQFFGYNSAKDKTNLAPGYMVQGSQNVYKTLAGTLANRPGKLLFTPTLTAPVTFAPTTSSFVWDTSWGATYIFGVSGSSGAGWTLSVLNNAGAANQAWVPLLVSNTQFRYVFDKWYSTTEAKDRLIFVNGTPNIFSWSGGIANIASTTSNTITKVGSTTWQQAGFSTTSGQKNITINGHAYAYTGGEGTGTLTGVTPDPTVEVNGSLVVQTVLTTANPAPVAATQANNFCKVINNQLYLGSYTSRICNISSNSDYTNFTVPTPRVAGSPELLTLDSVLKGIGVRKGNAHIGLGTGTWAVVSFSDITVGTTLTQKTNVDVRPVSSNQGPLAHEFIANVGDTIVYLDQGNQVRLFTDSNLSFTPTYPSISLEVATELQGIDFTGGSLKCIGEFTYITSPIAGITHLYQVRQTVNGDGVTVGERLWHAPMTWGVSRIESFNNKVYGFSSTDNSIYQLWDTNVYSDQISTGDIVSYSCIAALAYVNGGRRQGLLSFDKLFTEGYISPGGDLTATVNYEFNGSRTQIMRAVSSDSQPAYIFSAQLSSMGDNSIGDTPMGDEFGALSNFTKFKSIISLPLQNVSEYQKIYSSDVLDNRWEILSTGTNMEVEREQNATFFISKLNPK